MMLEVIEILSPEAAYECSLGGCGIKGPKDKASISYKKSKEQNVESL